MSARARKGGKVVVRWAPASANGATAVRYQVYTRVKVGQNWRKWKKVAVTKKLRVLRKVPAAKPGRKAKVRVRTVTAGGKSGWVKTRNLRLRR